MKAILFIKAAMKARGLSRPPYIVANAEFPGRLGGKSLYYNYTSEPMMFSSEEDLEELRRATAVLEEIAGRGRQ